MATSSDGEVQFLREPNIAVVGTLRADGRDVYGVPEGEQRIIVRVTPERIVSQRA